MRVCVSLVDLAIFAAGALPLKAACPQAAVAAAAKAGGATAAKKGAGGDYERADKSVIILPAEEVRIVPAAKGVKWLEDVAFTATGNPSLGDRLHPQGTVPARFLTQFFSAAGLELAAEFYYECYSEARSELVAQRTVENLVNQFIEEHGQGKLRYDKGEGQKGEIEILATRDQVQKLTRSSRWRERLIARGASTEEINTLLSLFQKNDADLFAVTEKQVEDWPPHILCEVEALRQPGVAKVLEEASNKETLTEQDFEKLRSELKTLQTRKTGGGGGSFLGIVSFGAGGGFEFARADALREQERRYLHDFVRSLNTYRKEGHFPVPPKLDLCLLSKQQIHWALNVEYGLALAGKVATHRMTSLFSSAAETLPGGHAEATPSVEAMIRREQTEAQARQNLENLKRTITNLKEGK